MTWGTSTKVPKPQPCVSLGGHGAGTVRGCSSPALAQPPGPGCPACPEPPYRTNVAHGNVLRLTAGDHDRDPGSLRACRLIPRLPATPGPQDRVHSLISLSVLQLKPVSGRRGGTRAPDLVHIWPLIPVTVGLSESYPVALCLSFPHLQTGTVKGAASACCCEAMRSVMCRGPCVL